MTKLEGGDFPCLFLELIHADFQRKGDLVTAHDAC
jgi:hypothetical protein